MPFDIIWWFPNKINDTLGVQKGEPGDFGWPAALKSYSKSRPFSEV